MNRRTTSRAVAFVFSALVTLVTLAGMDSLAQVERVAPEQWASAPAGSPGA